VQTVSLVAWKEGRNWSIAGKAYRLWLLISLGWTPKTDFAASVSSSVKGAKTCLGELYKTLAQYSQPSGCSGCDWRVSFPLSVLCLLPGVDLMARMTLQSTVTLKIPWVPQLPAGFRIPVPFCCAFHWEDFKWFYKNCKCTR
jgi:hypothetical protein